MKVNIIPENCIACGLCYLHAPDVFDYHDNGIVKFNNSDKLEKEYFSDDKITNKYYDARTVLADGGLYCLRDDRHYIYCQPSSLFELRIGNGGLKVTDGSVFKMTDGTNWTPL